jgi:negative regulator of sigma E activity
MSTDPESVPRVDEQLSAWLDDELPAREQELLVARLTQAPELQARVARYALIGSCLRGGRMGSLASELAALHLGERVRAALEGASEPVRPADARRTGRWLPYAVVTGVALVAVAIVPLVRMANYPAPVADQTAASPVPLMAVVPAQFQRSAAQLAGTEGRASLSPNRMTTYLVYHGEFSGMLSGKVSDSHIINNRPYATAVPLVDRAPTR